MANTSKRGFASMDPNKQKEIASKGGRAAHAKGTAHEFTSDEARVAGRKGGEAVSRDRAHMSTIGREGGHSRGARARAASTGEATDTPGNSVDYTRGSDQSFERQTVSERSGFEAGANRGTNTSNDRDRDRNRDGQNNRDQVPYSNRENI
jgi:hypothetical protein